jgi:predicted nucleic acid-binding Zn ribbon protein
MPTYVFRCETCGLEHDRIFTMGERPEFISEDCTCGGDTRHIVAWAGGVSLKGAGWASKPERDTANFKKGPQDPATVMKSRKEAGYA